MRLKLGPTVNGAAQQGRTLSLRQLPSEAGVTLLGPVMQYEDEAGYMLQPISLSRPCGTKRLYKCAPILGILHIYILLL